MPADHASPARHPPPQTTPVSPGFGGAAIVIGCLFVLLMGTLVRHEWGMYTNADRAVASFGVFRATLIAMEKVSAERGPMNAALGAKDPLPNGAPAPLRAARHDSDVAIQRVAQQLDARTCQWCIPEQPVLQHVESDLAAARASIDELLRQPRDARSDTALNDAVTQMALVARRFAPIVDASQVATADTTSGALDALQMARFAAILRDEAGLLGSRFTSALDAGRPLTSAGQLSVERSYGRVDQLRLAIESLAATNPALMRGKFARVNGEYFTNGIAYIGSVRALTGGPASPLPSTAEFAAQYVPTMHPIVDFRDEMLARADATLLHQRSATLRRFILVAGASVVLASLLFALFWLFRRYVIMPFTDATRAVIAIAGGDLTVVAPSHPYHRDEVQSLFDAVDVLRTNSRERLKLEQERDELIGRLQTMAETDALTGLLNRRAFENRARVLRTVARAADAGTSFLTLVEFDLDHFKRINDTYGHPTGDEALKTIGNLCRNTWRQQDIVARMGGEEFAVLLETAGSAEALETIERFRRRMQQVTLHAPDGTPFKMTASFGVVVSTRDALPDIDSLLVKADALLYQAKTGGRNRVIAETLNVV